MKIEEETGKLISIGIGDIGETITDCTVTAVKVFCPRNSGNFVSFLTEGHFTVSGTSVTDIIEGGTYLVSGRVTEWNMRPQIRLTSIRAGSTGNNDSVLIASFLEDNLKGAGRQIASALARLYGDKVVDVLLNNCLDCAENISGLTKDKAVLFCDTVTLNEEFYRRGLRLKLLGLSQAGIKECFANGFTDDREIMDNPYRLFILGIAGFDLCDHIAGMSCVDRLMPERFAAAVASSIIKLHENTGSTYIDRETCKKSTFQQLNFSGKAKVSEKEFEDGFAKGCELAVSDRKIVVYKFEDGKCLGCSACDKDARFSSAVYFKAEKNIKRRIEELIETGRKVPLKSVSDAAMTAVAAELGLLPDKDQLEALYLCMYSRICVITGGPGTGKTTIMGILAEHFRQKGIKAVFAAPTGRAAKRLSESVICEACTIHRLLGVQRTGDDKDEDIKFVHNRDNLLEAKVVVIDEMSMVDTRLFDSLLDSIGESTSIILVGDPDQLPSVGCGQVLTDILSCRSVPSVRLTYRHRQGKNSMIAENAYRILQGQMPSGGTDDFEIIRTDSDDEAFELMRKLATENDYSDVACLTPTKNENVKLGTVKLNEMMQEVNTGDESRKLSKGTHTHFAVGDRVMQIKNDYSIEWFDQAALETAQGVFNGEIGIVEDVDVIESSLSVRFDDGKLVLYHRKNLEELELAYAITVHKAQGAEFDKVLITLGKMNYLLYQNRLLYTAVTRGRKRVVIIDSCDCLSHFLKDRSSNLRDTSLKDFLAIVDGKRSAL